MRTVGAAISRPVSIWLLDDHAGTPTLLSRHRSSCLGGPPSRLPRGRLSLAAVLARDLRQDGADLAAHGPAPVRVGHVTWPCIRGQNSPVPPIDLPHHFREASACQNLPSESSTLPGKVCPPLPVSEE